MDVSSWIFHDPLIVKLDAHDLMKIWCPVFIHILEKKSSVFVLMVLQVALNISWQVFRRRSILGATLFNLFLTIVSFTF